MVGDARAKSEGTRVGRGPSFYFPTSEDPLMVGGKTMVLMAAEVELPWGLVRDLDVLPPPLARAEDEDDDLEDEDEEEEDDEEDDEDFDEEEDFEDEDFDDEDFDDEDLD